MNDKDTLNPLNSLKLFGLTEYFKTLIKFENNNKFPNALLLTGDKGTGKFTLINHFLNYIFSKETYNLEQQSINSNSVVFKNINSSMHQNIFYFTNHLNKDLQIDDARILKSNLNKSNLNNKPRFIVIDNVEYLNKNTINALLKTIEEPNQNNFFILINNKKELLLETIVSRCFQLHIFLKKNDKNDIKNMLINHHNLNPYKNLTENYLSPGLFLKYSFLCETNEIKEDLSYIEKLKKLFLLYRKNKDINFINLSIFFTEKLFYELILKRDTDAIILNNIKIKILKLINQFVNFNLNLPLTLNSINAHINDEK